MTCSHNLLTGSICVLCGEDTGKPSVPYAVPELRERGGNSEKTKARWRKASKKYREKDEKLKRG